MSTWNGLLYQMLPELYRVRDRASDKKDDPQSYHLQKYLAAFENSLLRIHATLEQKLNDVFPETAQGWLLPYFAELLQVKLYSPDDEGRRVELAEAIYWRKRKGTRRAVEHIVSSLGDQYEIQESLPKVLVTPWVGLQATGNTPRRMSGLPMGTVDLRVSSLRVKNPDGSFSQQNPNGAPKHPGSSQDTSRCIADTRAPNWKQGHHHPKRVLIYVAPQRGFFVEGHTTKPVETVNLPPNGTVTLSDQIIKILVLTPGNGTLILERCAIESLEVSWEPGIEATPTIECRDCLIGSISASAKLPVLRLAETTILGSVTAAQIRASGSIFGGSVSFSEPGSWFRYSRIPLVMGTLRALENCTSDAPIFVSRTFGEPGYGVLHPACPSSIREGAEDGTEIGAFYQLRYAAKEWAVMLRFQDELPLGQRAALIPDKTLLEQ